MQLPTNTQQKETGLEAHKMELLENAVNLLQEGMGVLVSQRMFEFLCSEKLLVEKDLLGWKVPTLKIAESKTIYVWVDFISAEDFTLPPYAHRRDSE